MEIKQSTKRQRRCATKRMRRFIVEFVLEVLGACGAIWGCSEAVDVRKDDNGDLWRIVSGSVGVVAFLLFAQARQHSTPLLPRTKALVLEVLGSGGAIWGVAEIIGLRTRYPSRCGSVMNVTDDDDDAWQGVDGAWAPGYDSCRDTYTLWRVVSWTVVFVFACHWTIQTWYGTSKTPDSLSMSTDVSPELRHVGLLAKHFTLDVLGGAGAVWGVAEVCYLREGWASPHFGQRSFDIWRVPTGIAFVFCLFCFLADRTWRPAPSAECRQKESPTVGA